MTETSLEHLNYAMLSAIVAPSHTSGSELILLFAAAQWPVFVGPALLILIWILGDHGDRRSAVTAGLSVLLALIVAHFISSVYMHPRPFMEGLSQNYLGHVPDSSFPSDHCTLLFALAASLYLCRDGIWPGIASFPAVLGLLTGWARVRLGAHFPLDIAGAVVLAFVAAALCAVGPARAFEEKITGLAERLYFRETRRSHAP